MAVFQWTIVQSRLGRRVAALFVLSGLFPLVVLTAMTGWMVSDYLLVQEQRRLRALAKESAMASLSRLLDLEERLRMVPAQPAGAAPMTLRGAAGVGRIDPQGRLVAIAGTVQVPVLDASDRTRLAAGHAVLRQPARTGAAYHLVVPADPHGTLMVAAIEPRTLWAFDERISDGIVTREVCGGSGSALVVCTDPHLEHEAFGGLVGGPAGVFTTRHQDQEWLGAYWSAPLRVQYGDGQLTAMLVTRTADAVAPARALIRTFVLVVVAATCVLLLVGLRQIRRLLDPIARLQAGTATLARGEFATRVEVHTGDELQALSESFNAMAGDLQRQFDQLHVLSVGTLEALARTIDAKSPWTAGHSTRVAGIAVAIGQALQLDGHALERLRRGALLHDIGKIGISAEILDSPAALTAEQRATIQQHPLLGARILEPLPHCADILPMVLQHHERFDGNGYPAGLAGDAIHFDARILAVADVYDAMTSERPYRRGLPARDAAVLIAGSAGSQFDPEAVAGFMAAFRSRRIPAAPADATLPRSA